MNKPLSFEEWADTKAKTSLFSQMANDYADYYFNFMIENRPKPPEQDEWHYLDWKPSLADEDYYTINHLGSIVFVTNSNNKYKLKTDNVFQTHKQAEYHLRMVDLAHEVKKLSFKPDWSDGDQNKYFLHYIYETGNIDYYFCRTDQHGKTCFETEGIAKQAIELFKNNADFLYCLNKGLI